MFSWVHQRGVASLDRMTNVSRDLRLELAERAGLTVPEVTGSKRSADGTLKLLLQLEDGEGVECVLIPEPPRLTACLSVQAGCRMGCSFCATGTGGLRRDLTAAEIIAQLYSLRGEAAGSRLTNVVLMGMGEPLDNLGEVADALSIISDPRGICIGARKTTVSTVGLPGGIPALARLGGQYGLAVSLHSAVQKTRERLVPAAGRLPLGRLVEDAGGYAESTGRRVTFEYCLIAGVNDTLEEAAALAELTRSVPCKVNLLLYNPVPGLPYERPGDAAVHRFIEYLYPRCPAVTLRRSRGTDIAAACGQLAGGGAGT